MKFLFCKTCKDVIQLTSELKSCQCRNVIGKYAENGITVLVHAIIRDKARIVGIANSWLENDHMHFDDGYAGSFNDVQNPKSMFNILKQPIVIVRLFTTGDVKQLKDVAKEILTVDKTEEFFGSTLDIYTVKKTIDFLNASLDGALGNVKGLEDVCMKNNWKYPKEVQAFYANDHKIRVLKELIEEVKPKPYLKLWSIPIGQSGPNRMTTTRDRIDDSVKLMETYGAKSVAELDELYKKLKAGEQQAKDTYDIPEFRSKDIPELREGGFVDQKEVIFLGQRGLLPSAKDLKDCAIKIKSDPNATSMKMTKEGEKLLEGILNEPSIDRADDILDKSILGNTDAIKEKAKEIEDNYKDMIEYKKKTGDEPTELDLKEYKKGISERNKIIDYTQEKIKNIDDVYKCKDANYSKSFLSMYDTVNEDLHDRNIIEIQTSETMHEQLLTLAKVYKRYSKEKGKECVDGIVLSINDNINEKIIFRVIIGDRGERNKNTT